MNAGILKDKKDGEGAETLECDDGVTKSRVNKRSWKRENQKEAEDPFSSARPQNIEGLCAQSKKT